MSTMKGKQDVGWCWGKKSAHFKIICIDFFDVEKNPSRNPTKGKAERFNSNERLAVKYMREHKRTETTIYRNLDKWVSSNLNQIFGIDTS